MNNPLEKFQDLLRDLFQFDCADLDFGIYRIMNHKRDVIERFITQDLPKAIAAELERGALAEQSQAARELQDVAAQIKATLGADTLDADGNLAATYHGTPLGTKYLSLKARAAGARGREAIAAGIYNYLYAFFSRYYQDGDFLSKRRYAKRERYAIPYNGEEVYLYWANHDQYYVKTAEYFTDYAFTAPNGVSVHFKLQTADVEQNNVKDDKRFFLPRLTEISWDKAARQLVIPFAYRPLTEQENIAYGQKNQQEAILAEALEKIPKQLSPKTAGPALSALTAEKRKTGDGQPVTFLEHHLRQYTRRNTSDFFIHKDLKGFLSRELDFYLKNEVLHLDEMEASGEDRAEGWFQMMRVIKAVGSRVIEFLHQIEEFQKTLWEKRKFIIETQYCITVGRIAEDFYPEIAACEPQWAEWKALFHVDEGQTDLFTAGKGKKDKRIAFLKAHPTLVLDTKHFERDFLDWLLGSFEDLDEMTDGLLIHSENWQALNFLVEKYRETVKCVYIDPPYNTGSDGFVYKDSYQHASWMSLMADRLRLARELMTDSAGGACNLNDIEEWRMRGLIEAQFGEDAYVTTVITKCSTPSSFRTVNVGPVDVTDRITLFTKSRSSYSFTPQPVEKPVDLQHFARFITNFDDAPENWAFKPIRLQVLQDMGFDCESTQEGMRLARERWGNDAARAIVDAGAEAFALENSHRVFETKTLQKPSPWLREHIANSQQDRHRTIIVRREGGEPIVLLMGRQFYFLGKGVARIGGRLCLTEPASTLWSDIDTNNLRHEGDIEFPAGKKPLKLVQRLLKMSDHADGSQSLDFFAGSGTTGHAVINLNREDGGRRKFILVEMADYFDTVLLPRLKKVTFTPEWKDGKPKRMATAEEAERSPRIVQYFRLESYEDALNNIAFDDTSGQQAIQFDDYLLQYMLKWETRKSETLLNVEKLARPFHYKLHIYADGQTCERPVDIPETFNYLLGLHVQTRRVYDDGGRRYLVYRGRIDQRTIAVIWRATEGWQKADFERDKKFVAEQKLSEGANEVFVNGDSLIPGARALEPIFKARMFAPVEA